MPKYTTAQRLRQIANERGLKQIDIVNLAEPLGRMYKVKIGRNDVSQYFSGKVEPRQNKLYILAKALNVSEAWLMGFDVSSERETERDTELPTPNATSDFVTFPVVGEIAAGYDSLALEDWNGETVDIPSSYFKGRDKFEFFVLEVKGDSMYPEYQEGDRVLILKQSTLEYSGQIGAVLYEDTHSTLKKVEYAQGQDWMKLVPINPSFKTQRIEGEALEHCKVIGIPRMLIRDIKS